jgi:hypothetical protein
MTLGQRIDLSSFLNCKASWPVRTLQIFESVDRNSAGARGKLKQSRFLFGIPSADDLPETLDNLILLLVTAIVSMLFPVVNVNISNSANQKLELSLIEHIDQVGGNKFVEAGNKGVELLFHSLLDFPFRHKPGIDVSVVAGAKKFMTTHSTYSFLFSLVT